MINSKKEDVNKYILYTSFFFVFLVMGVWSYLSPLWGDDYGMQRMNFTKIINACKNDYFSWNGRFFGQFFFRILVNINPLFYGLFNGLMFFLLTYLIFIISKKESDMFKNAIFRYLLIVTFLFLFTPSFAQVYLWRAGSGNYLWTTTIIIIFMYLMINNISFKNDLINLFAFILTCILGFVSGLSNENTPGGMIIILFFYFCYKNINKEKIIPFVFSIIGYLILLLSPGSKIRLETHFDFSRMSLLKKIFVNLPLTNDFFIYQLSIIILIFIFLFVYSFIFERYSVCLDSFIWFFSGVLVLYALDFSPEGAGLGRSSFGGFIFMLIGIFKLITFDESKISKFINLVLIYTLISFTFFNFINGFIDSIKSYNAINNQNSEIIYKRNKNDNFIKVKKLQYIGKTKYSFVDGNALSDRPDWWANKCYSYGFNVKNIVSD